MIYRNAFVSVTFACCMGLCSANAQWTEGGSPVIGTGETVTISTQQPTVLKFIDNGTLNVGTGGSVTINGTDLTVVGNGIGGNGVLNLQGGSLTNLGSSHFVVGYLGGTGSVTIASGSTLWIHNDNMHFYIAKNEADARDQPSHGEVTVSGLLHANNIEMLAYFPSNLTPPYVESARLTINAGGVVEAGMFQKNDTAACKIVFNGGTLRMLQNTASPFIGVGVLEMVIADGKQAIFDTNGKDVTVNSYANNNTDVSLSGETQAASVGNGGLVKTGAGKLIFRLSASKNTFTGAIEVVQGTLDLGRPLATNQTVTVHSGAAFVVYSAADAGKITLLGASGERLLYTVGGDTDSLNLTALNGTFYDDRLGSPLNGSATLSGNLTHSASVGAVGAPFRLLGQGGTLNLTNTLLETAAMQVEGSGTFNFMGSRTYTSSDAGKLVITDGGYRQDQTFALADASPSTPASLSLATGRFSVGNALDVGVNGYGEFAANGATLSGGAIRIGGGAGYAGAFTQSIGTVTANAESFVGFDGGTGTLSIAGGQFLVNGTLRVAGNPGDPIARTLRPNAFVTVSNALLRCDMFNFTPWWPTNGSSTVDIEAGFLTLQPDAQVEVAFVNKDDDPISTILFDGGLLRARGSIYGLFTLGKTVGSLRISATAGRTIRIDTGTNTVTLHNGVGRLSLSGAGGFEKLGGGTLSFSAPQVSYAGDTLIDAGTLYLGSANQIPDGAGKGNVQIATNAVLDLNGKSETVNRLIGLGSIVNSGGATTLGVLADGSSDTWYRKWLPSGVALDKQGTGTLSIATSQAITNTITVSSGTLRLTSSQGYPFYRFKIEGVKDANAVAMQLSEFALFNGDVNVTANRTNLYYDTTGGYGGNAESNASPDGERPEKAVDNNPYSSKWLDYRIKSSRSAEDHERVWIRLDFPSDQKITRYNWATGNDAPDRDPTAWRLQGSNNGTDWINLDVQSGFYATDTRNTWVSSQGFSVSPQNAAPNPILDSSVITVATNATLLIDGVSYTLGGLSGLGTVTVSNADLTVSSPSGTTNIFGGEMSGNGTLIKTGSGMQGFYGTHSLTGSVTVQNGTFAIYGSTPLRWFRFTIKKNRDNMNVTQLSEFSLISKDGTRQNLNLTAGSSVDALQPGQFATPVTYPTGSSLESTDKLFDNNSGTKWCVNNNTPSVADPLTYYILVMRLADSAPEITGYNICTANDCPERNPVTWSLEGSADGTTWLALDSLANVAPPTDFFTWYNGGVPYTLTMPAVFGGSADVISDTAVVEVRAGATLLSMNDSSEVIGALRIDLLSAGTITQLTPKPNGALYFVNTTGKPTTWTIPLVITRVQNVNALKSWKIYADGVEIRGYTLLYDSATGTLRLNAAGTLITVK